MFVFTDSWLFKKLNDFKKNIKLILLVIIVAIGFSNCEEELKAPGTNYITFGKSGYSTLVDPGSSTTFDIPVFTANTVSSDRTFSLSTDGSGAASGTYTVPSSITIPGGTNEATLSIQLSDPGIAQNVVSISFDAEAGLSTGNAVSLTYTQSCNEIVATLDFSFDYYSSETGWSILDANGDAVASKAEGSYSDGQWTATENISLCQGRSYTLVVTDYYGDGMNDGTNLGSYTLTVGGVVKVTGGGSFGASESNAFDTN